MRDSCRTCSSYGRYNANFICRRIDIALRIFSKNLLPLLGKIPAPSETAIFSTASSSTPPARGPGSYAAIPISKSCAGHRTSRAWPRSSPACSRVCGRSSPPGVSSCMPPAPSFPRMRSASTPFWARTGTPVWYLSRHLGAMILAPAGKSCPVKTGRTGSSMPAPEGGRRLARGAFRPGGEVTSSAATAGGRPGLGSKRRSGLHEPPPAGAAVQVYAESRVSIERLQELGYEPRRPEADCLRDDIEPI